MRGELVSIKIYPAPLWGLSGPVEAVGVSEVANVQSKSFVSFAHWLKLHSVLLSNPQLYGRLTKREYIIIIYLCA